MGLVRDMSALVPVWLKPGGEIRVVTAGAVIIRPPGGGRLATVADVLPTLRAMAELWTIRLAFDRNAGGGLVAQQLADEGLIDAYDIAQESPIMAEAADLLRHLVVEERLEHDQDPGVTAHVLAAVEKSAGVGKWRLAKQSESRHIDAAVALAMAVWVAIGDAMAPLVDEPFLKWL
jgi:phage terminase large subunit-like protein